MAKLSKATMKLNSLLHRRVNVERILTTVLHKKIKAWKKEHHRTSSDVNCHEA